jgi:hypothetical protein
MLDLNNIRLDINKLSNRLDTTNTVGLALFTGGFIVNRIDKRERKEDMKRMGTEMRIEAQLMYDQTRKEMKEMRIETQNNNRFTLFVAVLAIVIPILTRTK